MFYVSQLKNVKKYFKFKWNLKELYQEIILDHAKNPRNKGKCEGYNHDAKAHNPLCGDKVHIYLKLDKDKNISGLKF